MITENQAFELNSSALDINTGAAITPVDSAGYDYCDPVGQTGVWAAVVTGNDFKYNIPSGILSLGRWKVLPFIVSGGEKYYADKPDEFVVESASC